MMDFSPEITKRFWDRVDTSGGCWTWKLSTNGAGYGLFCCGHQKRVLAHRYSYEQLVGPIPNGYQVDHLCKNTICVRPDHLEAVEPHINNFRSDGFAARHRRKTQCPAGHAYDLI